MYHDSNNPYTVSDFKFKDGKAIFSISIDTFKARYVMSVEADLRKIIESKSKELPSDKEFSGEVKWYKLNDGISMEEQINVMLTYRQLSDAEAIDKLEADRINYFVNNLEAVT